MLLNAQSGLRLSLPDSGLCDSCISVRILNACKHHIDLSMRCADFFVGHLCAAHTCDSMERQRLLQLLEKVSGASCDLKPPVGIRVFLWLFWLFHALYICLDVHVTPLRHKS